MLTFTSPLSIPTKSYSNLPSDYLFDFFQTIQYSFAFVYLTIEYPGHFASIFSICKYFFRLQLTCHYLFISVTTTII